MRRCWGFGVNFSETDELCQKCEDSLKCLETFAGEQIDILAVQSGRRKLPIMDTLKAKENPPIVIMIPKSRNGKIIIEIHFDKNWLKKQLGFGMFDNDKKED